MTEEKKADQEKTPLIFGYGKCFALTLLPAMSYLFSKGSFYQWESGPYALFHIVSDMLLCLLAMVPGAFLLRLFLRRPKVWHGCVVAAILIASCIFFGLRGSRSLSYLDEMLPEVPQAVEYFHQHREEMEREAVETACNWFNYEPPVEPAAWEGSYFPHTMAFIYVSNPKNYPKHEGQQDVWSYAHFLDDHWYLLLGSYPGG